MPGFIQTGPFGEGPMTGRRMGKCTNYGANFKQQSNKENENQTLQENLPEKEVYYGRGQGFGFGRRRGWRCFGRGQRFGFRGNF